MSSRYERGSSRDRDRYRDGSSGGRGSSRDRDRDHYRDSGREGSSRDSGRNENSNRVYVGGLDERTSKRDVEDFFRDQGRLSSVWVARKPPGFAFVEFEDPRDAADAVRDLNGRSLAGRIIRVELSGQRRERGGDRGGRRGGGGGECYECGETGHFARECPRRGSGDRGGRGGGRSSRRKSRSRSRSPVRSRSRSPRRDRSASPRRDKDESKESQKPIDHERDDKGKEDNEPKSE